jgi:TetR/AcrR family transcriptional regulator, acrAB operon repressor
MRRTKEESARTRRRIIAAARRVFAQRGVTRTSLGHVADAAGVTRGAIYWHFANKRALFDAMRECVSLPLADRIDFALLDERNPDPLRAVQAFLRGLFDSVGDRVTLETFEITQLKCEYVDEFAPELARQLERSHELVANLTRTYARARRAGMLRADLTPDIAALETCAFATGLFRLRLIDRNGALLGKRIEALIGAHIDGRRVRRAPAGRAKLPLRRSAE